ncbi:MAG TPA: GIY-YIG nuclease family protein [Allosphingosinicella sp.]|nr:GIY-YIG nuclease family protein [Allosphingosinicella sp.]
MRGGWVYMMADRYRGTIYTGVTADIARRTFEHRESRGSRFVAKYSLLRLVYLEPYERIDEAIAREKAIKKWRRAWKIELIEKANPDWLDLFEHTANA